MSNQTKDYASLKRKLASGMLLEDAATASGMTVEEAKAYLDGRESEEDHVLMSFSDNALMLAFDTLQSAISEGSRVVSETCEMGGKRNQVLDLDAAKALLKAGLDARKLLNQKKKSKVTLEAEGMDLFDAGPWSFKKSD